MDLEKIWIGLLVWTSLTCLCIGAIIYSFTSEYKETKWKK